MFKDGDTVILKSGFGPSMTVEFITPSPIRVHVVWFDRNHTLNRAQFSDKVLDHLEERNDR